MSGISQLVLHGFGGTPEITPTAFALKTRALKIAGNIADVKTPEQQISAVEALRELREVITGMESTRKAVKAPVLALGKKIDALAHGFIADVEKQFGRLQGLINHYQRKEQERLREEQQKVEAEASEAAELRRKAAELKAAGGAVNVGMAESLTARAFDLEMRTELAVVTVTDKPKGLVVRQRINFQVTDAIVFVQGYPKFWKWNEETETLKLDRMLILDELNREGGGLFHKTVFPEELSATDDPRLVRPAGLRVYEETKAHVR